MAVYGVSYYGVGTYGFPDALELAAAGFRARPEGYDKVFLEWGPPGGTWSHQRLVRSSYGLPMSITEGTTLFEDTAAGARLSYMDGVTEPLKSGRFYYYTLFVYVTSDAVWWPSGYAIELVPTNHGSGERMWDLLPEVHREQDRLYADSSDTGPLYRFLQLFGFQFDRIRTEVASLLYAYDIDRVSGALLPVLAQQFGIDYEPELGQARVRAILKDRIHLLKLKGTKPGIEGVVSSYTGFGATAVIGPNLMLDYNDSHAKEGVGHWVGTNGTVAQILEGTMTPAVAGTNSFRLQGNGSTPSTALLGSAAGRTLIPVDAGTAYVFSAYVTNNGGTARTVSFDIIWVNEAGGVISTTVGTTAADTSAWIRRNVTATAPALSKYAQVRFNVVSAANGENHFFGAAMFEAGTVPSTTWEGARQVNVYVDPQRKNHVPNPGAEVNTTGWGAGANTTLARSTTQFRTGTASFRLTATALGDISANTTTGTGGFPVTPGEVYTASAYFRAGTTARNAHVRIYWYTSAGAAASTAFHAGAVVADASGNFNARPFVTATAPANAAYAAILVHVASAAAAEIHYVDDLLFEQTEFLRDYFDGSLGSDYVWSGTAHQSASNYYARRSLKDYRLQTVILDYMPAGTTHALRYGLIAPASSV
jgi:phage tail-like protein